MKRLFCKFKKQIQYTTYRIQPKQHTHSDQNLDMMLKALELSISTNANIFKCYWCYINKALSVNSVVCSIIIIILEPRER